jgi:hypothetical protein
MPHGLWGAFGHDLPRLSARPVTQNDLAKKKAAQSANRDGLTGLEAANLTNPRREITAFLPFGQVLICKSADFGRAFWVRGAADAT